MMNPRYLAFLLFLSSPSFAQDAPKPSHHPAAQIEQEKQQTEARKKELEKQSKKLTQELDDTQETLVDIAGEIKKNEQRLTELDAKMSSNRKEQDEIGARLKKDRRSIGDLVLALERLDRTPPEAVLARPGAPLETAQSAMLLQSILPNIYGRAESLKKDLKRLDDLLADMKKSQEEVKTTAAELAKRQDTVAALLKKRKGLYAQTQTDLKSQEAALREISVRAESLKDLVSRIEQREKEELERTQAAAVRPRVDAENTSDTTPSMASARPTPIPRAGSAQLPISGIIRVGYKQMDDIGAESQGLTIEGRAGALVVSPMGGVVRYAGYFKNYGQIIIVEHQKDFHSLIAGLARIDTVVGQSVAAGEPVGTLAKSAPGGGKPTLYYELRLNGEPVNPARKFAGL
ncbi:MAG: peptidase M23 [Micavibrio aeruginosavorus]|uniref:Peptidase M23 n=1 Tax=Micavibrio aeruginosavorus TaxID=349221 RepID=A0A2W5PQN4_9BACT|nr:MAG: peptidase M23 [Micavibrio aeruginosavorus]